MKQDFFRTLFLMILSFSVVTLNLYPQDSLLIDNKDYRLFYVGRTPSLGDLKSKFICHTAFVNIPIDPSFYKAEYPNPCSPSMVKEIFLYQLKDSSNVIIYIIDSKDSVLFDLKLEDQTIGYYSFIIKANYYMSESINNKVLSSLDDIRIVFLIEDEIFSLPLRNIN